MWVVVFFTKNKNSQYILRVFSIGPFNPTGIGPFHSTIFGPYYPTFIGPFFPTLIYQFRSCDRKHYEDILIEPFYPGSKATIYDIYLILAKSSFRESCSGKLLSYRIRYDIRKKFSFRWHVLFGDTPLPLESFDRFLNTLHALNSRQLLALFGTSITFCQEISPRFRKR